MNIRQLTKSDLNAWKKLRLHGLSHSPENFSSSYEEEAQWSDDRFAQELNNSYVLGACLDTQIIACVGFYRLKSNKTAHRGGLWGMYTHPDFRNQGVGTRLLQKILQYAKNQVSQVHLTCVTNNLIALSFYQKHGFYIYGTEPNALKINNKYYDEHLMVLQLHDDPCLVSECLK